MRMKGIRKNITLFAIFAIVLFTTVVITVPDKISAKTSYSKTIEVNLTDGQDATSAIQNALNDAEKAGTKKKQALVKIPAGTYYLSRTLVIG